MITDDFLVYFAFQLVIFIINILGYAKIPELRLFGVLLSLGIAVQTVLAFAPDYYAFGAMMVVTNTILPIYSMSRGWKNG
jgi:hypothetical protein